MKCKGQMSLEYLWIYALALIIIIFVFGVVVDFGITTPQDNLPERCFIESVFECVDYHAIADGSNSEIVIVLKNNVGRTINLSNVTVASLEGNNINCDLNNPSKGHPEFLPSPNHVSPSEEFNLTFTCYSGTEIFPNEMVKLNYELKYIVDAEGYFDKYVDGSLVVRSLSP